MIQISTFQFFSVGQCVWGVCAGCFVVNGYMKKYMVFPCHAMEPEAYSPPALLTASGFVGPRSNHATPTASSVPSKGPST